MNIQNIFKGLSLTRFLEEVDGLDFKWVVKRLSGNDTGLTGGHQAGLYLPRAFVKMAFPEICTKGKFNPDFFVRECFIPSADISIRTLRAVYYNSKYFPERGLKKKYDEFRLTRWGGRASPLQDHENTGSICVLGIRREADQADAVVWVAASIEEENAIEAWLGEEVEPGRFILRQEPCLGYPERSELEIPPEWQSSFPSGREIFSHIVKLIPRSRWEGSMDELLLKRRDLEFRLFEQIERQHVLPKIVNGFTCVEGFIKYAHSVSNRRKSRAGTSLELNLESIFLDESIYFETQVTTENRKRPDFLFPSRKAYHDASYPAARLHMLASKTCCKDRWRQILNEANRITTKHLFTLQEGVSENQLGEMKDNNVELVVPAPLHASFPKAWRPSIISLDGFVNHIRAEQESVPGIKRWTS